MDKDEGLMERLKTMDLDMLWSYYRSSRNLITCINVAAIGGLFAMLVCAVWYLTIPVIVITFMLAHMSVTLNQTRDFITERIMKLSKEKGLL